MIQYRDSKGRATNGPRIKKMCRLCHKSFSVIEAYKRLKFCSLKCWYKFAHGKNNPAYKGLYIIKICKGCNKKFRIRSYYNFKKFCSQQCYLSFIKKENHPNWLGGKSREPYSIFFDIKLKEEIRKRDNYECQLCYITEEEHIIVFGEIFSIHHIDYDKRNCEKKDLITLCHNCHTRTNYNRTYWQEYFEKLMEAKYGMEFSCSYR